ncbi:unnamed protein product [Linum trigynum]
MTTVLISSVILRMIIGGFQGSTVIVISAEAALDPMCAGSHEWFCSETDFDIPLAATRQKILYHLTTITKCTAVYEDDLPEDGAVPVAYRHSSCADDHTDSHIPKTNPNCFNCLKRATVLMNKNCPDKDGAQYGTEQCCARYEKFNFCGATN